MCAYARTHILTHIRIHTQATERLTTRIASRLSLVPNARACTGCPHVSHLQQLVVLRQQPRRNDPSEGCPLGTSNATPTHGHGAMGEAEPTKDEWGQFLIEGAR